MSVFVCVFFVCVCVLFSLWMGRCVLLISHHTYIYIDTALHHHSAFNPATSAAASAAVIQCGASGADLLANGSRMMQDSEPGAYCEEYLWEMSLMSGC